ncbi:hypothetical protein HanHA89_Chr05g0198561 [Helianthus annuus]|nr:hypothetical protein HanHA89_Chr05g0198561 [Helianthus annuus]
MVRYGTSTVPVCECKNREIPMPNRYRKCHKSVPNRHRKIYRFREFDTGTGIQYLYITQLKKRKKKKKNTYLNNQRGSIYKSWNINPKKQLPP